MQQVFECSARFSISNLMLQLNRIKMVRLASATAAVNYTARKLDSINGLTTNNGTGRT